MLNTAIEKQKLKLFMDFNFKWSSKNHKVNIKSVTPKTKVHLQTLDKNFKSYRINKIEHTNYFSSQTKNLKDERVDMAAQIAGLQTQITNKNGLRLKDRDIVVKVISFLKGAFKHVPSFQYVVDYLNQFIFLDPVKHGKEIMVMKQKCGFYEDVKVSFRELFEHLDEFADDSQERLRNECDELRALNQKLSSQLLELQASNDRLNQMYNIEKEKFKDLANYKSERIDLVRECLKTRFELIGSKSAVKVLYQDSRNLGRLEEEFKFYKIDALAKANHNLSRNAELEEEIISLKQQKEERMDNHEMSKKVLQIIWDDLTTYHNNLKTFLKQVHEVKTSEKKPESSAQRRFSTVVHKALQAKNLVEPNGKQFNKNSRHNTRILTNDVLAVTGLLSPDINKEFSSHEANLDRKVNARNTLTPEHKVYANTRSSYFLSQMQDKNYTTKILTDAVEDISHFLSNSIVDVNMKWIAYDLIKLLKIKFLDFKRKFEECGGVPKANKI